MTSAVDKPCHCAMYLNNLFYYFTLDNPYWRLPHTVFIFKALRLLLHFLEEQVTVGFKSTLLAEILIDTIDHLNER